MSINKISQETKKLIKSKTSYSLPNNPSAQGFTAKQIKEKNAKAILDDETSDCSGSEINHVSVVSEINRIVEEVNTEFTSKATSDSNTYATKTALNSTNEIIDDVEEDIDTINETLLLKANTSDVSSIYSTKTEMNSKVNQTEFDNYKNNVGSTHASKTEVTECLSTSKSYTDDKTNGLLSSATASNTYATKSTTDTLTTNLNSLLSKVNNLDLGIKYEIISSLPSVGVKGKLYLLPSNNTGVTNLYEEYLWITNSQGQSFFEKIGEMNVTTGLTESEVNNLITSTLATKGYQTQSQVENIVEGYNYQNASQVDNAITSKGYKTASDIDSIILNKGLQSSSQVESAITSKGYQTQAQVTTLIQNYISSITYDGGSENL